jgi:hypothetical protein
MPMLMSAVPACENCAHLKLGAVLGLRLGGPRPAPVVVLVAMLPPSNELAVRILEVLDGHGH